MSLRNLTPMLLRHLPYDCLRQLCHLPHLFRCIPALKIFSASIASLMAGSLIANSSFSLLVSLLAKYASPRSIFDDTCSLDTILHKKFFPNFRVLGCLLCFLEFSVIEEQRHQTCHTCLALLFGSLQP